ncbi:formyltetrahydrofolate deformylase [Marinomonas algarum]|uniref:Formyltetrahydrofolate deformylase n=1 Tax=Marinomonas algarum TaxID=2883105 RepID=A0A9X1IP77_9GAMM|nr:formyltetrahydrofolate deformylase [Marinomonas algarum]MCB5162755.1 formyltetrahydrofolate deformylase [Marinomonas algarum]
MKLKLTPTQNLCIGYLESGFTLIERDNQYYFVKGHRCQKVLPKTLEALVNRGALEYTEQGDYLLSDEFMEYRKQMRYKSSSKLTCH